MKVLFMLVLGLMIHELAAQTISIPRNYETIKVNIPPQVDADFNDEAWKSVSITSDFIDIEPNPGNLSEKKTDVMLVYDDNAIYIAAEMKNEPNPLNGLAERDGFGNASWFAFTVDAYESGVAGLEFFVTAAGVQCDAQVDLNGEDFNWNAVWKSAVKIIDDGWRVEIEIPYSALRFPNKKNQQWNVNFGRSCRKTREKSFWNEVKPEVEGFMNQSGKLTGITDIKTPVRLSFSPYVSASFNHFPENNVFKKDLKPVFNAGMDIKYGINDAFTLDMTLVPDFSQTVTDAFVLNLGPFEVQYNENRQFFTEGVDLFNKAGLFYSRRIGGFPVNYWNVDNELNDNEEILENPTANQLINATKISGRTDKGLGVGIFNALEAPNEAVIVNTETNEERILKTSPFVNYNVVVLDQNLEGNAYITLTNTNVTRFGSDFYDANVTGFNSRFTTQNNNYAFSADGALSQKSDGEYDELELGYKYNLSFRKTSGKLTFNLGNNVESTNYDPNDLGFLYSPNERSYYLNSSLSRFKPLKKLNRIVGNLNVSYQRLFEPDVFANFVMNVNYWAVTKKNMSFGHWFDMEPVITYDYFEPRTSDFSRFYEYPKNFTIGGYVSSDYSKKIAVDANYNYRKFFQDGRYNVSSNIILRFQPNSHWLIMPHYNIALNRLEEGYADEIDENLLFGRRHIYRHEYGLNADYAINNKMIVKLRSRHNWTRSRYQNFGWLNDKGRIDEVSLEQAGLESLADYNVNFNAFTIDLGFQWVFAPGSELSVLWKNIILGSEFELVDNYSKNFKNTLKSDQTNSLSFKVLYYIDYLYFNKWFKKGVKHS